VSADWHALEAGNGAIHFGEASSEHRKSLEDCFSGRRHVAADITTVSALPIGNRVCGARAGGQQVNATRSRRAGVCGHRLPNPDASFAWCLASSEPSQIDSGLWRCVPARGEREPWQSRAHHPRRAKCQDQKSG